MTTSHDLHPLLRQRRSTRAFSPRDVSDEVLLSMLEAARWAPSCNNVQPWRFLVAVRGEGDGHGRIADLLTPSNRSWAAAAPVLMLAAAELNFPQTEKPNRHALHDVGLAIGMLSVQATAMGLAVHQMAGFSAEAARVACGIPEGFEPVSVIALGYPGEPESLPEPLRSREMAPRTRHAQESFVFSANWGTAR